MAGVLDLAAAAAAADSVAPLSEHVLLHLRYDAAGPSADVQDAAGLGGNQMQHIAVDVVEGDFLVLDGQGIRAFAIACGSPDQAQTVDGLGHPITHGRRLPAPQSQHHPQQRGEPGQTPASSCAWTPTCTSAPTA